MSPNRNKIKSKKGWSIKKEERPQKCKVEMTMISLSRILSQHQQRKRKKKNTDFLLKIKMIDILITLLSS
jgi:hypothetical protein